MLIDKKTVAGHSHNVKVMSNCQRMIFEIKKESVLAHVEGATYRREWRPALVELHSMVGGQCSPIELIQLATEADRQQKRLNQEYPIGEPALT